MDEPLIIQYTNLLHQYGGPSDQHVKAFVEKHSDDLVFVKRAQALNQVFQLKKDLVG